MNYYQKWLCSFSNKLLENVTLLSKMTLQFCYIYSRAQIKAASVSTESPAMKVLILFCIIAATASADESIHLSEGEPLLVRCPGKSIGVMITGKGAGSWNVELQDSEGCSTSSKPESNSIDRMEDIDFKAVSLPSSFKTQVIGEMIIMVPANQSKFAVVITKPYWKYMFMFTE